MGFDCNLVLRALDLFDNNEQQAIDALLDGRVPESDTRHVLRSAHQQQQLPKLAHDRVLGHIIVPVPLAHPAPAASASAVAPMYISQRRRAAACVEGQVPSAPLLESPFSVHFPPPVESDENVHVVRLPPKLRPLRESRILSTVPRDTVGDFLVGVATMQLVVTHCPSSPNRVVGIVKWINFRSLGLLYSATRDSFSSKAFHGRCDGRGATLVLVKSVAGHVFGGYTPTDWGASSRLDCKESFIFHATCENGTAPQRYSRRWSSSCMSQQQDSHNTHWFSQPVEPFRDGNGLCADRYTASDSHPKEIDASNGPAFGARHVMMYSGSSPITESLCNDMVINLDSRHGVARFISFYNDIDGQPYNAFTPHTVTKPFFPVKFKHPRQSWNGGGMPSALLVDPGVCSSGFREGSPNHQFPDSNYVPCFEVADVEVFQVQ